MTDVTIPADMAKALAVYHRARAEVVGTAHEAEWHRDKADLLDPTPPTLREKVAQAMFEADGGDAPLDGLRDEYLARSDAALAFIADKMAKRPLLVDNPPTYGANPLSLHHRGEQRDADVAWLRGEQS